MVLNDFTKKFLKQPKIQELINSNDLHGVYEAAPDGQKPIIAFDLYQLAPQFFDEDFLSQFIILPKRMFISTGLQEVVIPENVEEIGPECFKLCPNLRSVKILGKVREIPAQCFEGCMQLEKVVLPESVYRFGRRAFYSTADNLQIILPKTGKKLVTNQAEMEFLKAHLVEKGEEL